MESIENILFNIKCCHEELDGYLRLRNQIIEGKPTAKRGNKELRNDDGSFNMEKICAEIHRTDGYINALKYVVGLPAETIGFMTSSFEAVKLSTPNNANTSMEEFVQ